MQLKRMLWQPFPGFTDADLPRGISMITGNAACCVAMSRCRLRDAQWEAIEQTEVKEQTAVIRDIFGNPFRPVTLEPAWRTATVTSLAQTIYDERAFDRLPILADALEDAGCTNADILGHSRGGGEHVRGCWVVDLVLGKV